MRVRKQPPATINLFQDGMLSSSFTQLGSFDPYHEYTEIGYSEPEGYDKRKLLSEEQSLIYSICNSNYEELEVQFVTGLKHRRLYTIQNYFPQVPYGGDWMPFIDLFRYITLPRLIPREIVVKWISEDLKYSRDGGEKLDSGKVWRGNVSMDDFNVHSGWATWAETYGTNGDGTHINRESSAEEIYDFILSLFKGGFKTMKPTKLMKELKIWSGDGRTHYTDGVSSGDDKDKKIYPADYGNWDIVIPQKAVGMSEWDETTKCLNSYGLFNGWMDLTYAEHTNKHSSEYENYNIDTLSSMKGDYEADFYFLAGALAIFTTPPMYDGYDYLKRPQRTHPISYD